MIIDEYAEVTLNNRNVKYYEEKGYNIPKEINKRGRLVYITPSKIFVKVNDLHPQSTVRVNIQCDCCGDKKVAVYREYLRNLDENGLKCCIKCKSIKARKTNLEKYGFEYPSQADSVKEKIKATNLKMRDCEWAMSDPKVREKSEKTNLLKYGHRLAIQNDDIKSKAVKTLCYNNSCETSRQQKYLFALYGGKLNYPCNKYCLDILLDNIDIEYDGGAHDLCVKIGSVSSIDFYKKEIVRNSIVKRNGYKIMKIISGTDKLPTDEILINMLEISKLYFNSTNHSWIEWYIDENKYRNAENRNGSFFDYGITRRIYKKDISEESA